MATPGDGGVFRTLAPTFDPGYKIIFKVPETVQKQPEEPPAFSDPRGILPGGLVPASQLSYEIFEEVSELAVVNNFEAAAANISLGFVQVTGEVLLRSKSTISLIVFEGRDVVDLPTEDLPRFGNSIIVPDNVFLPIFAGDLFIKPKESLATKAALEYVKKSAGNNVVGISPSANPPLDSLSHNDGIFPKSSQLRNLFVDVASRAIEVSGSPKFVTYVAADKPLYRDVVFMSSSAIGQGIFEGNNLVITFAAPFGETVLNVFRYAFIDFNADIVGADPMFQWRLSESFGILPPKTEKTPASMSLSPEEKVLDIVADQAKHFVYNLKDESEDITDEYPYKPKKTGFSPMFATAKADPESPFFDKNFKAQIIPFAKNNFFNQSRLEIRSVFGLSPSTRTGGINRLVTERVYRSPFQALDFGPNTRVGLEYAVHNFANTQVFGKSRSIVLVSTKPAADGIAAYYDRSIGAIVVLFVDNETASERAFDDTQWEASKTAIIESELKAFLAGEMIQRSSGYAAMHPPQKKLDVPVSGTKGNVTIPNGFLPTSFIVDGNDEDAKKPAVLQLFAENISLSSGNDAPKPIFEAEVPSVIKGAKNRQRIISVPSIRFKGFRIKDPSGSTAKALFGAETAKFLDDMPAPKASDDIFGKLSAFQMSQNKAEDFPIKASNIAAATTHDVGHSFIAYENSGRVDMGYRVSHSQAFWPVRDVCLRISEELKESDLETSANAGDNAKRVPPTAGLPFLIGDRGATWVYLFYEYKNRVLMKRMPAEIFTFESTDSDKNKYDPDIEVRIAQNIQRMLPFVVYDGKISDPAEGAKGDKKFGTIKFPQKPEPSSDSASVEKPQIMQHSACKTLDGLLVSFIQDGQRIRARKSSDDGETWRDIFDENTTFLPKEPDSSGATSSVVDGDAPYCYYEEGQQIIMLFFIVDNALLSMNIPDHIVRFDADMASLAIKDIKPAIIYGDVSDNLEKRGIGLQETVKERKSSNDAFNEKISPHRVVVERTSSGHPRLFFSDQDKILRSLLSGDGGHLWQTEDQFISNR